MKGKYLLSIVETGKQFGIGKNKMYEIVHAEPDVPVVKIGKFTRINSELFKEWINKVTVEGRQL